MKRRTLLPLLLSFFLTGCVNFNINPGGGGGGEDPVDPPYVPTYTVDKETFEYYIHGDFMVEENVNFTLSFLNRSTSGSEFIINEMVVQYDGNYIYEVRNQYRGFMVYDGDNQEESTYKYSTLQYFDEIKNRTSEPFTGDSYELNGVAWNKHSDSQIDPRRLKNSQITFEMATYNSNTQMYTAENGSMVYRYKFLDGKLIAFDNYVKGGIILENMYEITYGNALLVVPGEYSVPTAILNEIEQYNYDLTHHTFEANTYTTAVETVRIMNTSNEYNFTYEGSSWTATAEEPQLRFDRSDVVFTEVMMSIFSLYVYPSDFGLTVTQDLGVQMTFCERSATNQLISEVQFELELNACGYVTNMLFVENSIIRSEITTNLE